MKLSVALKEESDVITSAHDTDGFFVSYFKFKHYIKCNDSFSMTK